MSIPAVVQNWSVMLGGNESFVFISIVKMLEI